MRVIHERVSTAKYNNAIETLFAAKDRKSRLGYMTIVFQLHEFWTLDHVPDENEADLETFAAWESRAGLGPDNRDPKYPPFGYLGAIPLGAHIIRPTLTHSYDGTPGGVTIQVVSEAQPMDVVAPEPLEAQGDLFPEAPDPHGDACVAAIQKDIEVLKDLNQKAETLLREGVPVIKSDLTEEEKTRLFAALGKGQGKLQVPAVFSGKRSTIKDCLTSTIPEEFLDKAVSCST